MFREHLLMTGLYSQRLNKTSQQWRGVSAQAIQDLTVKLHVYILQWHKDLGSDKVPTVGDISPRFV